MALVAVAACSSPDGDAIPLVDGSPGIGFDDLRWSPSLGRVIAPAGRAGAVDLVDPQSGAAIAIQGFSKTSDFSGGHDDGPTSADEGAGLLFVTDRTSEMLSVVDPRARRISSSARLSASPDYVRFVEHGASGPELWVTEPAAERIEIFAFDAATATARSIASIPVPNGPESLVIDPARGRAYTHEWQAKTLAIDLRGRAVVERWDNGCAASRGIDLEPEHGFVLAACNEGTLTVLDPDGGRIVDTLAAGAGYDVIGYARSSRHVYLAGSACACLTVMGLARDGSLGLLGRFDAPSDTHCVVADDRGHAFVCAPTEGGLRRVDDPFPSWGGR